MKYFFMVICAFTIFKSGHAQDCHSSLEGKVIDQNTGSPLISARVKITGTQNTTYTDIDGKYRFENLCDGKFTLRVTHENAEEVYAPVIIQGETKQDIELDNHPQTLSEVVVVGHSVIRKSATAQEQSIDEKAIDTYSSASLGDALKQMSGVSSLNTGKSIVKPVIQGLSSSRVPILNNGVRMEDQEWGADHAPSIDLNSAGKLTVIKGAAALKYGGDAIGGVVISDKPDIPRKDTLYGKTILSGATNGRGGSGSTSLTKSFKSGWYVNAQGTYKKFGDYKAPDYTLSNTGESERDFSVNAGLNRRHYGFDAYYSKFNNHLGILRASSTGSVEDLVKAINQDEPLYTGDFSYRINAPRQKVDHQLARVKFYRYFDGVGKLNVSYSFQENQRLEYDIRRGENKYKPSVDLNLKTHAVKADFDFNARNDYALNVGVDGNYKTNFANPQTGVQRIIPDYKSLAGGAFLTGHYAFKKHWLGEAGLRYDYSRINAKKYYNKFRWHNRGYDRDFGDLVIGDYGSQFLVNPDFDYSNLSATAGVRYRSGDFSYRLNYAMSNRAPNPSELFSDGLHHSAASLELGDLRLGSEHSHKIGLSVEKQRGDLTFTVAPYVNFIDNYINTSPHGLEETVRGVFLKYEYQQNDARLIGLDLDVHYHLNQHFSYQGKFSTVDGRKTENDRPLIDMPATRMSHAITYKKPSWHDFFVTLHGDAVFKKQHYPDNNFKIKVLDDGVYQNEAVDISTPPEGYFLTGLSVGATFHPYRHGAMDVNLSVDNLFNVGYRDYLNRLRYYADNTGRNISLQLKFTY